MYFKFEAFLKNKQHPNEAVCERPDEDGPSLSVPRLGRPPSLPGHRAAASNMEDTLTQTYTMLQLLKYA